MIPVVLSPEEVRAALAGTLTEIRRPVDMSAIREIAWITHAEVEDGEVEFRSDRPELWDFVRRVACPFGGPGAALFGQESWAAHWMYNDVAGTECWSGHPGDNYWYEVDGEAAPGSCGLRARGYRGRWREPSEMPAWASRLAFRNRGVLVEQVDGGWYWVVGLERVDRGNGAPGLTEEVAR